MEVITWDDKKMIASVETIVRGFAEDFKLIKTGQLTHAQTLSLLEQQQVVFAELAENMKLSISAFTSVLESFHTINAKYMAVLDLTPGTCRDN